MRFVFSESNPPKVGTRDSRAPQAQGAKPRGNERAANLSENIGASSHAVRGKRTDEVVTRSLYDVKKRKRGYTGTNAREISSESDAGIANAET